MFYLDPANVIGEKGNIDAIAEDKYMYVRLRFSPVNGEIKY